MGSRCIRRAIFEQSKGSVCILDIQEQPDYRKSFSLYRILLLTVPLKSPLASRFGQSRKKDGSVKFQQIGAIQVCKIAVLKACVSFPSSGAEKGHQLGKSFQVVRIGRVPCDPLLLACNECLSLQSTHDVLGDRCRNRNPFSWPDPAWNRVGSPRKIEHPIEHVDIQRIRKGSL